MNVARHHFCKRLINHAVPLQQVAARECLRLDPHRKVPRAALSARMSGVFGTVVPDRDPRWGEGGLQSRLDTCYPGLAHAARVRDAIQKPWAITNTNVRPSIP